MWRQIPCSIYRGGTSKAIFFLKEDLPDNPVIRDRLLLSVVGNPDPMRLNGLGGLTINASKVIIINKSDRENIDIDYTHGQVSLSEPVIDYTNNGGNISFAVGLFSLNKKLVDLQNDQVKVRIFATTTQEYMVAHFPSIQRSFIDDPMNLGGLGSAEIHLEFSSPGGGVTGTLFPTGSPMDEIEIDGKLYRITIIDAGNLTAQVHAEEIGLSGTEINKSEIQHAMPLIERIHQTVRKMFDLKSPSLPKIMIIEKPKTYLDRNGQIIDKEKITLCARDITWGNQLHPAFPVTGTVAFAISCRIPGTIVNTYANVTDNDGVLKIGHPSGIFEIDATVVQDDTGWHAQKITVVSTATAIIDGKVWVPELLF